MSLFSNSSFHCERHSVVSVRSMLAVLIGISLLSGCASMSQREQNTATGATIGAATGALLGAITKNKVGNSAVVGGVIGAIAGNMWSTEMEQKRADLEQAT